MNNILLPTTDAFVEDVAIAIARNRLYNEASAELQNLIGVNISASTALEQAFDGIFDRLWAGAQDRDSLQRDRYREDARIAISAINLKLLTTPE